MENASKALIIVGAVLIAILLIGFGVMIMNNSTSQVSPDALNSQAAQTHNAQFNNYTGKTNSAAQIKQLMNIITSNNVTGKTADTPQKVYVYYIPQSTTKTGGKAADTGFYDPAKLSSTVRNGYTYTVDRHTVFSRHERKNSSDRISGRRRTADRFLPDAAL